MSDKTLFSRIIDRELPATFLYEDEHCVVIEDIAPQAAIHLLIIPKKPLPQLSHAENTDQTLLGHLMLIANHMARERGVDEGFRLIINNGLEAGQTVPHLHLHLLAGSLGAFEKA